MKPSICYIVNVDWFFLSHRLPIALAAQAEGYEVHIACGITDGRAELESHGFHVHPLSITRGRSNLLRELWNFVQLLWLLGRLRPQLVHLITIKPVLYGGMAARVMNIPAVVVAIPGLGFMYGAKGRKMAVLRRMIYTVYRWIFGKKNIRVIFQNPDDLETIHQATQLATEKSTLLDGSGIDLEIYKPQPLPSGTPVVVMACRLLADKGVWEFVEAARILHHRNVNVQLHLAGAIDPSNPVSLTEDDLSRIREEGLVTVLGKCSNMEQVLAAASIVALPSYYGEGLPKILIEAAACGRAVITTDMPGCRDAIEPNVTGLLVPVRDVTALANAIQQLVSDPAECEALGKAGRVRAEKKFDIRIIVRKHLALYTALLKPAVSA